jgi:hypothetical protein
MTRKIGPVAAYSAYTGHELLNTLRGQPFRELFMDMHNNAVGLDAARHAKPIPNRQSRDLVVLSDKPNSIGYRPYPKY